MGRFSESARRAAAKMRNVFPGGRRPREPSAPIHLGLGDDEEAQREVLPSARSPLGQRTATYHGFEPPAAVARPSRPTASAGFRFLATNESTSTVSSCSFERTICHERRHRHPVSDDDDDNDGHESPSSAPDASDDQDPRLEERSDTSSLFGTHNSRHASAARGSKAEGKPCKLRLPSFVRNRAAAQRDTEEGLPKRFELGEDEEWELYPNEVGPIQFSIQDLFAIPANDEDLSARRVDKRHSI